MDLYVTILKFILEEWDEVVWIEFMGRVLGFWTLSVVLYCEEYNISETGLVSVLIMGDIYSVSSVRKS
jgi:hypothetical protein